MFDSCRIDTPYTTCTENNGDIRFTFDIETIIDCNTCRNDINPSITKTAAITWKNSTPHKLDIDIPFFRAYGLSRGITKAMCYAVFAHVWPSITTMYRPLITKIDATWDTEGITQLYTHMGIPHENINAFNQDKTVILDYGLTIQNLITESDYSIISQYPDTPTRSAWVYEQGARYIVDLYVLLQRK